jgi:two-component system response regulator CpxR
MKLLIIDDDKEISLMVKDFLNGCDFEILCASDAETGIEILKNEVVDLIFLDFKMPDKDGEWFIRNASIPRRTKVILITAHLTCDMITLMFKLGIAGYIMKPFGKDELMCHLDFYLNKNSAETSSDNDSNGDK